MGRTTTLFVSAGEAITPATRACACGPRTRFCARRYFRRGESTRARRSWVRERGGRDSVCGAVASPSQRRLEKRRGKRARGWGESSGVRNGRTFFAQSSETSVAKTGKKNIVIRVRLKTRTAVRARKKRVGHGGRITARANRRLFFTFLPTLHRQTLQLRVDCSIRTRPPFSTRPARNDQTFWSRVPKRSRPALVAALVHALHLGRCFTSSVSKVR